MAKFNHIDVRGTKKVPSAFGNVFICSGAIGDAKTVTFPDGYLNGATPEPNLAFKAVFANGHNAANASSYLSLNGIVVVSNQNGALLPLPVHAIIEGGSTVYKVLQPNTVLELYYTADYDGNGTAAWVVVGNPVVLSSSDYTIYADGQNSFLMNHPVGSIYWSSVSTSPQTLYGGTWTRITGTFVYAAGTNDTVDGTKFTKEVGNDSVKLVQNNLPDHHHKWSETTGNGNGHRHTIPDPMQASGYAVAIGSSPLPALGPASTPPIYTGYVKVSGVAGKIQTTGNADIVQTNVDIRPKLLKRYCWERTA